MIFNKGIMERVQTRLFHFSEVHIELRSFCTSNFLTHFLQNKQTKKKGLGFIAFINQCDKVMVLLLQI